jgi:serine/threonine protein kinase
MLLDDPADLGPYTLIGRLGHGGYGVVYLAESPGSGRVAIKLLRTQLAEAGGERERFAREAAAAKQVARFCTAQVLDADIAGDQPYIVSEYVAGPSLQSLVAGEGPIEGGRWTGSPSGRPPHWSPSTRRASSTATSSRRTC